MGHISVAPNNSWFHLPLRLARQSVTMHWSSWNGAVFTMRTISTCYWKVLLILLPTCQTFCIIDLVFASQFPWWIRPGTNLRLSGMLLGQRCLERIWNLSASPFNENRIELPCIDARRKGVHRETHFMQRLGKMQPLTVFRSMIFFH